MITGSSTRFLGCLAVASFVGCGTPEASDTSLSGKADDHRAPQTSRHLADVTACNTTYASSAKDQAADLQQYACLVKANNAAVPIIEGNLAATGSPQATTSQIKIDVYRADTGALSDQGALTPGTGIADGDLAPGLCGLLMGAATTAAQVANVAARRCAVAAETHLANAIDEFVDFKTSTQNPSDGEMNAWKANHPACYQAYNQATIVSDEDVVNAENRLVDCLEADFFKTTVVGVAENDVLAGFNRAFADIEVLCDVVVDAGHLKMVEAQFANPGCLTEGLSRLDALVAAAATK
jgi:hypothetical protein